MPRLCWKASQKRIDFSSEGVKKLPKLGGFHHCVSGVGKIFQPFYLRKYYESLLNYKKC